MDSILMTLAIRNGNPNATVLTGNQAREEAAVHSLEAPSDPNWKTYFSGWRLTPKFTFSVFRCSVYVKDTVHCVRHASRHLTVTRRL